MPAGDGLAAQFPGDAGLKNHAGETALKAGYDDYLPKPTDPGLFLDQIEKVLHRFKPELAAKSAHPKQAKVRYT